MLFYFLAQSLPGASPGVLLPKEEKAAMVSWNNNKNAGPPAYKTTCFLFTAEKWQYICTTRDLPTI